RVEVAHVQRVEGPGLGDVDHAGVFLPEDFVVPKPPHPARDEEQGDDEGVEEEEPVAVQHQPLPLLVHHQSHHGEEGEDVEDE
ncbi:hypothetical protein N302_04973, partial [Corvus brachyrhynchos]